MRKLITVLLVALLSAAHGDLLYKKSELLSKTFIYFGDQQFSYDKAIKHCQELNATIVHTRTIGEARWLSENFNVTNSFWIGLRNSTYAIPNRWLDGSKVAEPKWKSMGNFITLPRCTAAVASVISGEWLQTDCNAAAPQWNLICEIGEKINGRNIDKESCDDVRQQLEQLRKENEVLRDMIAGKNVEIKYLNKDKVALMHRNNFLTRELERLSRRG